MTSHYDLLVVGGGTGGLRAAVVSAKTGYKTAVVEPGAIGGTCLNTGCIPTKTLLHAAHLYNEMQNSEEIGIKAKKISVDFERVMGRMRDIVESGNSHAEKSLDSMENIDVHRGNAVFTSGNTVKVNDQELSANKIIIATGASAWMPPMNGLEETGYINNEGTLKLEKLPKTLIMIGGGYISCELACFFASFGCEVTILERMPKILGMLDEDVANVVIDSLEKQGIEIHTSIDIKEITGKSGKKVKLKTNSLDDENAPEVIYEAEVLFGSCGRRPNTKTLDLDKAGVELTERGHVKVNEKLQTTNENIYAIGDVNGKSPFAHTAKRESKAALENALLGGSHVIKHDIIPWAVFTFPTIGGVGLSEKQARDKGIDIGIMKAMFQKTGKAKIIRDTRGFVKVVYDKHTRNLLGCTIVGPDSHNLIHEFALLMNTPDPKIDYVLQTVHVHPTLAEVMEELKEVE